MTDDWEDVYHRQLFLWIGKANIVTFEEINKRNEKRHEDGFIQLNLFY